MTEGVKTPSRQRRRTGRDAAFETELGARIRAARVAARMTQSALAGAVGINYQKLQKYELGKDRIAVSTLRSIAQALNIHPGAFFDEHMSLSAEDPSREKAAQKTAVLLQRVRDPHVAKNLRALIAQLGKGDPSPEDPSGRAGHEQALSGSTRADAGRDRSPAGDASAGRWKRPCFTGAATRAGIEGG